MKSNYLLILVFVILALSSCKKNDDEVAVSDRATALLGQWEYTAIGTDRAVDINGDGDFNIDLFNTQEIRQCIKDNLTFFNARGVGEKGAYSINDNGLPCQEDTQFTNFEEDRYELINNNTISFDNRNEMRILELTKSKMIIDTNDNLGGIDVVVTITFTKS